MIISKPLFKQSCKANLGIWGFVTFITCAMLAIIIAVIGNLNVGSIRDSLVDMFVSDAIESNVQKQSMTYYNLTDNALTSYKENSEALDQLFNHTFSSTARSILLGNYKNLIAAGKSDEEARADVAMLMGNETAANALIDYYLVKGEDFSKSAIESYVLQLINQKIYEEVKESEGEENANYAQMFIGKAIEDYENSGSDDIENFATFYIPQILKTIFSQQTIVYQGRTIHITDYYSEEEIGETSLSAIISFKAEVSIKREQVTEEIRTKYNAEHPDAPISAELLQSMVDEEMESYTNTLIPKLSKSLLDELDKDVANALTELGELDISSLIIGSIFFRIAGILLPMIYIIMASNNLVASQVDSGSMAYVLSTPTKRTTVAFTQIAFLLCSLFVMFLCTTVVGLVSLAIVNSSAVTISYGQMLLFNLGAFITMFAISGICYLASSWFNRSKLSMAVGGGLSMFFLVATILGLFGSKIIPSAIRIDAMNIFNYVSIISLFDGVSIISGSLTYLWKLAILLVIGIACFTVAIIKFKKKDLPL